MNMKKVLILTCGILMMSTQTFACGGITVYGNSGASYCLSKHMMNWYSAYAWCEAQGMKLIDIHEVCGSYTSCLDLKLSAEEKNKFPNQQVLWVWTNASRSSSSPYIINVASGGLYDTFAARSGDLHVLCY